MSSREFDALPDADKRAVLVAALEQREGRMGNLRSFSLMRLYNVEYAAGKAGRVLEELGRYVCELRVKDPVYWVKMNTFFPASADHPTINAEKPTINVVTSMDLKSHVARSAIEHQQLKGSFGAIDSTADQTIKTDRFHCWLGPPYDKDEKDIHDDFPIRFLLKHKEAIKFGGLGHDGTTVQISLNISDPPSRFTDSRTMWLSPGQGFLPVRMHRRWEFAASTPGGEPFYSETETEIKELKEVAGVWFPYHFTQMNVSRAGIAQGLATVFETTVEKVELGTVADDDLQVHFASGAQVTDKIRGVQYFEGGNVEPTPSIATSNTTIGRWGFLFIVNGLALFALLALLRRRRANRSG